MDLHTSPRIHHLKIKNLLAAMAVQDTPKFFERLQSTSGPQYLTTLWNGLAQELPETDRLAALGLSVRSHRFAHCFPALVITLPPPCEHDEAYFLAAIQPPGGPGFVVGLEQASDPINHRTTTMLVGWTVQGQVNFGLQPKPSMEDFLDAVERILHSEREAG